MSTLELKVPSVGESITEVQIGEWLKSPGDAVELDEPIVVIETDKVTVELPAPAAGVLREARKGAGETAEVGEVIGTMEPGDSAPEAGREEGDAKEDRAQDDGAKGDSKEDGAKGAAPASAGSSSSDGPPAEREVHVMPAARRALEERGLRPEQVTPTGPGNRLLKEDVLAREAAGEEEPAPAAPAGREEQLVPMTPMRKRIAERLVEAQRTAAILTTFNEVDMSRVIALRNEHKAAFAQRHGVKLGFMSFFVKAAVEALKLVPQVNAEIRGDQVVYRNYFDVGIAVGGGKGLVVPVLRGAERMSFAEVERTIADLAARAEANELTLAELQGGTFTISNGGIYGSLLSTPILNPPQSGILGLHAIQDRPMAVGGEVVIRPMMYVALSYDHRIVDGREAVTFLKAVKSAVEDPARILLEI